MSRNTKTFAQITDFTRASVATYFDASGTLQTAASGVARTAAYRYNSTSAQWVLAGLLVEGQDTEYCRNSTATGAVVGTIGSGGTLPNTWSTPTDSMAKEVVATGTINGMPYVDIRFSGTVTDTGSRVIFFEAGDTVTSGQVWTTGVYIALIAGDFTNSGPFSLRNGSEQSASINITGTLQRFSFTATGTTTIARATLRWSHVANGAFNFTLRFALPQRRLASFLSSPILTTNAQVTRAADVLTKTLGAEFNQAGQSCVLTCVLDRNPNDGTGGKVLYIWGTANSQNQIQLLISSVGGVYLQAIIGNTGSGTINGLAMTSGTVLRIAFGFNANTLRLVINGTAYTDATISGTLPAILNRAVGSRGNALNGFITEATEYLGLLSIDQMKALTA